MYAKIEIDTNDIPDFRRRELGKLALELTEFVFSIPGAEEQYQEWLKKRKERRSE